jgi:hypothetical protein
LKTNQPKENTVFDWLTMELVTLLAILLGPISAVLITRAMDVRAEKQRLKISVLKDLMTTRNSKLDNSHVSAINMIQIAFNKDPEIIRHYKAYLELLNMPWPSDTKDAQNLLDRRDRKFLDLLAEIGRSLNFNFDKQDLKTTGYFPQAHSEFQDLLMNNARLLNKLLSGNNQDFTNFLADLPKQSQIEGPKSESPLPPRT